MTTTLAETAATLDTVLANALSAQWTVLGIPAADTSQNHKEIVESALWPSTATEADCATLVTAFIAKVSAEADGKTVVVLRGPENNVMPNGDGLSAYATVLLGFLAP